MTESASAPAKRQQKAPSWLQYIPALPFLIALEESVRKPAAGTSKQSAVINAAHVLYGAAEPLVVANNPAYAGLAPIVDAIVKAFNTHGWPDAPADVLPSTPVAAPTP